MHRELVTIRITDGYIANGIHGVRLDNNISTCRFLLSPPDVFEGCIYQIQYERPDGVSAIAVPESQVFGDDGTLTLEWNPSGDMFAVAGTGKIKAYATDADGTQMWNSHTGEYKVCETLEPSDNESIAVPPDELATYVAKAVESASKARASETNAKASEALASEYAESASASATSASASATNASASEVNAKTSETNVRASEVNARSSESNAKASEQKAEEVRAKRDGLIDDIMWRVERYQTQTALGIATTDSEEQYRAVLAYLEQLRQVPEQAEFPDTVEWPSQP